MSGDQTWKLTIAMFTAAHLLAGCAVSRKSADLSALPPAVDIDGWEMLAFVEPQPSFHDPETAEAWERGWNALVEGRLAQAHRSANIVARQHPASPELALLQGFVALRTGSWAEAAIRFETVRDADELSVFVSSAGGRFLLALNQRRLEAAFEATERIRERMAEHPIVKSYRTRLRAELAEKWLRRARERSRGELASSSDSDAYERALRYAPESAELHLEAARAARREGSFERAQTHAAEAVTLQPDNPTALVLYAELLADAGKTSQALEVYERAAKRMPGNERIDGRLRTLARALRLERPPAQFFELENSPRLTREQLAALLYIELAEYLPVSHQVPPIVTDVDENWARPFVLDALAMGLLHPRRNHTFAGSAPARFRELEAALQRVAALIGSPVALEKLLPPRKRTAYVPGALAVDAVTRLVAIAEENELRPHGSDTARRTSNDGSW